MRKGFSKLEQLLYSLEENWLTKNDQTLSTRTDDGGWSPLEAAWHIIHSETGTLAYMKKKLLAEGELRNPTFKNRWRFQALKWALILPLRFRIPNSVLGPPEILPNKEETLTAWKKLRKDWEAFLQDFPPAHQHKLVFRHPVAGMLTLNQTFTFLFHHFKHHHRQLKVKA